MQGPDPTLERRDGPTPAGGAYAETHYRDGLGGPAPKSRAVAAEGIEFDADGRELARTYFEIAPPDDATPVVARYLGLGLHRPPDGA